MAALAALSAATQGKSDSAQTSSASPAAASATGAIHQLPSPALSLASVLSFPGPGAPLATPVRSAIENSTGESLGAVRVHQDGRASAAVDAAGARAVTYGSGIFLGSRESPSDLGLMAHESAHALQQRSGSPVAQRKSIGAGSGALEAEADSVSAAVQAGCPAAVHGRTAGPQPQFQLGGFLRRTASAVAGGVRAAAGAVADVAGNIIERAIAYIRERASSIPGYDLLGLILGRDPLTQRPVERNAINLIRALLGVIPGGPALFENLQRARVIERAYEWVTGQFARLNLTWALVRGAIDRFLATLGLPDLANLGGVLERARAIFAPIVSRAVEFARAAGRKVLEFIFEGALALAGSAGQRILTIFRRIQATFGLIVADPVRFLTNLLNAVKGGFQRFADNILSHLRTALFEWLFGALSGAGLRLPRQFNLMGIVDIMLQVLGLTYDRMRQRMVRLIGEPAVRAIETGFEFVRVLVTQGLAAAWQKILEFATGLVDTVIEGIRNWVVTSVVRAAVTRLATMFNPVGAIINAIITIYNTVMFFIERARQIATLVESIVDSIDNIARGNIGAAIAFVERTMARALTVIISFLARLIGLGGISDRIRAIIQRIQATVDRAIDRLINWVRERARNLLSRALGGDPRASPQQRLESGVTEAVAALNRLSGAAIGRAVITPVLAAIRTRHRMQSLEAVDRGGVWHVEGQVNPRTGRATNKRSAGAQDGSSEARAIEIDWVKPRVSSYPAIRIADPPAVAAAVAQGGRVDLATVRYVTVRPTATTNLIQGVTMGVTNPTSRNLRNNYAFQARAAVTGNSQKDRMNRILSTYYGYDRAEGAGAPRDNDHVWEKQLGGPDAYENLWPLNESINRSSGSIVRSEVARIRDELRMSSVNGKWLRLRQRS